MTTGARTQDVRDYIEDKNRKDNEGFTEKKDDHHDIFHETLDQDGGFVFPKRKYNLNYASVEVRVGDRKFQETDRLLSRRFQETDRKFQETDKLLAQRFQGTENEIRRVPENVAWSTGKWGRFVEGLVVPAFIRLFGEQDIHIKTIFQRVKTHLESERMEVDILGVNQEHVVVLE